MASQRKLKTNGAYLNAFMAQAKAVDASRHFMGGGEFMMPLNYAS
jgi:hypothetical protein